MKKEKDNLALTLMKKSRLRNKQHATLFNREYNFKSKSISSKRTSLREQEADGEIRSYGRDEEEGVA